MTDHADTIRRSLAVMHDAADRNVRPYHADALSALDALLAEWQQAQETIRMHDAQAATFLARAEQAEAERQQAIDALREAPMPIRESIMDDPAWHDKYDEWWHARASEAALVKLGEKS